MRSQVAIRAKKPRLLKQANETLMLQVLVARKPTNDMRQRYVFRTHRWDAITRHSHQTTRTVRLPRSVSRKLDGVSRRAMHKSIVIRATHLIDVDGLVVKGRRTVDHVKNSTLTLADARARVQGGQGVNVELVNMDWQLNNGTYYWGSVNMTPNAGQCMYVNGSQGSDPSAFNINGMTPNQTIEQYLQAQSGALQPTYTGQDAEELSKSITEDGVEYALENALFDAALTPVAVLTDAAEALAEVALGDCDANASPFSIQASDFYGNTSSQAYCISAQAAVIGGSSASGGLADVNSCLSLYGGSAQSTLAKLYGINTDQPFAYAKYGSLYGSQGDSGDFSSGEVASSLNSSSMEAGLSMYPNVLPPGVTTESGDTVGGLEGLPASGGGDAGLSINFMPATQSTSSGDLVTVPGYMSNGIPSVELAINFAGPGGASTTGFYDDSTTSTFQGTASSNFGILTDGLPTATWSQQRFASTDDEQNMYVPLDPAQQILISVPDLEVTGHGTGINEGSDTLTWGTPLATGQPVPANCEITGFNVIELNYVNGEPTNFSYGNAPATATSISMDGSSATSNGEAYIQPMSNCIRGPFTQSVTSYGP